MNKIVCCCCFVLAVAGPAGCKKFLSKPPDVSQTAPGTVADYRALLDNNMITVNSTPGLGPLAVDDLVVDGPTWQGENLVARGAYNWDAATYQKGYVSLSWSNPYKAINICNVVLDGMDNLKTVDNSEKTEFNAVYGSALFYRAFLFYNLEETYGQPYVSAASANGALGIPLRLSSNALAPVQRSTVANVYRQLINDLKQALPLLPAGVSTWHNRPGQAAVWALLARISLNMQDFPSAKQCADSCLSQYNALMDYNTLKVLSTRQFPDSTNKEILFQCSAQDYLSTYTTMLGVDSVLFTGYAANDLRRSLFFQKMPPGSRVYFKGNYTGSAFLFSGLAVDEVFLISSECRARMGDSVGSLNALNTLLTARWRTGSFKPYTVASATATGGLLRLVLTERRKETLFRELRWYDLRRLVQDSGHPPDTIKRILGGNSYLLPPNDLRHTFQIPESEISLSGIQQNAVQ